MGKTAFNKFLSESSIKTTLKQLVSEYHEIVKLYADAVRIVNQKYKEDITGNIYTSEFSLTTYEQRKGKLFDEFQKKQKL